MKSNTFFLPALGTRYGNDFPDAPNSVGRYWTSSQSSSSTGYFLRFESGVGAVRNDGGKSAALTIRCVRKSNTFFLPVVGYRYPDDGLLFVTSAGYWSSTEGSSSTGFRLSISSGGANLMTDRKAFGYVVRCVR